MIDLAMISTFKPSYTANDMACYGLLCCYGQIHPITGDKLTHSELFRITKKGEDKGIIKLLKK